MLHSGLLHPSVAELFRRIHVIAADRKNLQGACDSLTLGLLLLTCELLMSRQRPDQKQESDSVFKKYVGIPPGAYRRSLREMKE